MVSTVLTQAFNKCNDLLNSIRLTEQFLFSLKSHQNSKMEEENILFFSLSLFSKLGLGEHPKGEGRGHQQT